MLMRALLLSLLASAATVSGSVSAAPAPSSPPPAAAAEEGQSSSSGDTGSARADPDLRVFGGKTCFNPPAGAERHVGPLAALLIPQLVGAGIDALTNALDAAGTDKVRARSAVIPLEYSVQCVQVAKGLPGTARDWTGNETRETDRLRTAPLMLELFLRQSADGSALLVTPTQLNYDMTVNGRQAHTAKRSLYATITIADASGQHSSQVTVPLGEFRTRPEPYLFDPTGRPLSPGAEHYPLGAANSVWIPNPFAPRKPAAQDSTPEGSQSQQGGQNGPFGPAIPPAPAGNTPQPPAENTDDTASTTTPPADFGTPISPISLTVVITETRPGNPIAKALAGILKGSRQGIVDAADPAKRQTALETEQTAADQKTTSWATARAKYSAALRAYCAPDATDATRLAAAPDLFTAQVGLVTASRGAKQPLPFDALVDPDTGRPQPRCPSS
jgi:hypothetical protein